jgi:hypothetical protein
MYRLIIQHNDQQITNLFVDKSRVTGFRSIIDIFELETGLDIGNYHLSQVKIENDSICVSISDEDLAKWRDRKLGTIID